MVSGLFYKNVPESLYIENWRIIPPRVFHAKKDSPLKIPFLGVQV